jgi:hypothetical protein
MRGKHWEWLRAEHWERSWDYDEALGEELGLRKENLD